MLDIEKVRLFSMLLERMCIIEWGNSGERHSLSAKCEKETVVQHPPLTIKHIPSPRTDLHVMDGYPLSSRID
jgi:hypothetical protein